MHKLQSLLVTTGAASSRRAADALLSSGRVAIDGVRASPGARAAPSSVTLDGSPLQPAPPPALSAVFALHKPRGIITAWSDPQGRATLSSLSLPPTPRKLVHAGRLDADSEGLLFLTDDGCIAQSLAHPSLAPLKTYVVCAEQSRMALGHTSPTDLAARLCVPTRLPSDARDGPDAAAAAASAPLARAMSACVLAPSDVSTPPLSHLSLSSAPHALFEITVAEGRKRLIRRLFAACGWRVERLIRVAVGYIHLGALPPGAWRPLSAEELSLLMHATGGKRGGKGVRGDAEGLRPPSGAEGAEGLTLKDTSAHKRRTSC